MNTTEMNDKFVELYNIMATSGNANHMKLFGETMQQMMADLCEDNPQKANEYIKRLDAIRWHNFLSKEEAIRIVQRMQPQPSWTLAEWEQMMKDADVETSEEPYYNTYALYAAMSMVYSDHISTIAIIAGKRVDDLTDDEILSFTHNLAVDKLTDEDRMFDIRYYFHVE